MEKRYEHDCKNCELLGQYEDYDLYYCEKDDTIVARHGNKGEDYTSCKPKILTAHSALNKAKELAVQQGKLTSVVI